MLCYFPAMYTRRQFGKLALTAIPAGHLLQTVPLFAQGKPNSKVRGVMIGMNVPYNFGGRSAPVDEIIQKCVQLGVSGLELRTQPVEAFLGLPENLVTAAAGPGRGAKPTPEQDAARKTATDDIRKWRTSVSMDKVAAVRKKFNDAGILIEIVKVDNILSLNSRSSTTSSSWRRRSALEPFRPRSPTSIRRRPRRSCRKNVSVRSPTNTS